MQPVNAFIEKGPLQPKVAINDSHDYLCFVRGADVRDFPIFDKQINFIENSHRKTNVVVYLYNINYLNCLSYAYANRRDSFG